MKYIILILTILLSGCTSDAQKAKNHKDTNPKTLKYEVKDGFLAFYDGIDLQKFQLEIEAFDVNEITLDHLLCLAADECDKTLIIELLNRGANVKFKCELDDMITSLAFCDENGIELTKILLAKGANINGADQENSSFLSYTIIADNVTLAKYLIGQGANKSQRNTNRNTGCPPLHNVKSVEMLKLLIESKFDIDEKCDNGRNVLHAAVRGKHFELAQYLLKNKLVDKHHKDINGETPLDYAIKNGNKEIQLLLK